MAEYYNKMLGKSKHILIFTSAFRPLVGGSEIALEQIVSRLNNFRFTILTPRCHRSLPYFERHPNYDLYRVGLGSFLDKYLFPVLGFVKAFFLARKQPVEALHAYQASYGAGAAVLLNFFRPSFPLIVTLQEGKNLHNQLFFVRWLRFFILKRATKITAISSYLADYARTIAAETPIQIIPNGVPEDLIQREFLDVETKRKLRSEINLPQDDHVLITVSRLVDKNGVDTLLHSFKKVLAEMPNTSLVIIGDGPQEKELRRLNNSLGVNGKVMWLGRLPYSRLGEYVGASDVFVRLSRSEGLGSAFLEAMAVNTPVVATAVGGITDIVVDEERGMLCQADNKDDAARKIVMLLKDRELQNRISNNAREFVRNGYTWQIVADKFAELYNGN